MVKFLGRIVVGVFILSNCLAQEASDEAVFKERLVQWVNTVNAAGQDRSPENIEKADEALRNLRKFAREYPDSKYADDVEFIRYNSTEEPVEAWEEFAAKYPDGKLEDLTKGELRKLGGNFSSFAYECYIPYELMPVYVKGKKAWLGSDYAEAEKDLSDFVMKVDMYYADLRQTILEQPYLTLMSIYKSRNKRSEFHKVKDKFIRLFPDKKELAQRQWSY